MFERLASFLGLSEPPTNHVCLSGGRRRNRRLLVEHLDARQLLAADFDWAFALDQDGDVSIGKVVSDTEGHAIIIGSVTVGGDLDVDPSPAEFLLDMPDQGSFIAEYDADGALVWAQAITGTAGAGLRSVVVTGQGANQHIAVIGAGNAGVVEIGGGSFNVDDFSRSFVVRLDTNGSFQWASILQVGLADVAFDSAGNVVTTGINTASDFVIAKHYATTGAQAWQHVIPATYAIGNGIVVDPSGRIVVGGQYRGNVDFDPGPKTAKLSSQSNSGFVAVYTGAGSLIWAKSFSSSIYAFSKVTDVAVDGSGNVYSVGVYNGSGQVDYDPGKGKFELPSSPGRNTEFVAKLSGEGNFRWAKGLLTADATADSFAAQLAVDAMGSVFVVGAYQGAVDINPGTAQQWLTGSGGYLLKLDTNGNFMYALTSPAIGCIALAPGGRLLIGGGGVSGSVDLDPDPVDEAILTVDRGAILWSLWDF